jgi:hypothetical protein
MSNLFFFHSRSEPYGCLLAFSFEQAWLLTDGAMLYVRSDLSDCFVRSDSNEPQPVCGPDHGSPIVSLVVQRSYQLCEGIRFIGRYQDLHYFCPARHAMLRFKKENGTLSILLFIL